MKPKILVTRKIFPETLNFLKKHAECEIGLSDRSLRKNEIKSKIKDKQGLFCLLTDRVDKEVIDSAPDLKIISNCAVGYDNIDIEYAKTKNILVTNTPGILTETTADLTWALIFSVARRIPEADKFVRANKYKGWELDLFLGKEITGKQLGIIGMGRIGKAVARKALAFNLNTVYTDPKHLSSKEEKSLNASFLPLDRLLSSSDIITIHTILSPDTHHLISKERISLLKKEAIIINVARGPIIDEDSLAEALKNKRIWGAGLDVYEREPSINKKLLTLKNVVLLPHIGSATIETRLKMANIAAHNLVQGISGKKPDNLIPF
ncbi:MAG: 2-hydroxyacid dehydrogenase [Candidatus Aminicenantaceae bacterium]